MEFYQEMKKNEILSFAMTWMELESIMLSESSQKDKYHMISYVDFKKQNKWAKGKKDRGRQTKKQTQL